MISDHIKKTANIKMEAHFGHVDSKGNLAVIALMFGYGAENPVIKELWEKMPAHAGEKENFDGSKINTLFLLPASKDYYRLMDLSLYPHVVRVCDGLL